MQRKLLEECVVGDLVTFSDLLRENAATKFAGELTLPNGEVRRFEEVEKSCLGGTDFAWKRVD